MAILTRAELEHYPGATDTEREIAHARELAPKRLRLGERAASLSVSRPSSGPLSALPAELDLRPFPGRDRTERVMAWLIAHLPRAAGWSRESLRELAQRLAVSRDLVE